MASPFLRINKLGKFAVQLVTCSCRFSLVTESEAALMDIDWGRDCDQYSNLKRFATAENLHIPMLKILFHPKEKRLNLQFLWVIFILFSHFSHLNTTHLTTWAESVKTQNIHVATTRYFLIFNLHTAYTNRRSFLQVHTFLFNTRLSFSLIIMD